jgi:hypothetical protein
MYFCTVTAWLQITMLVLSHFVCPFCNDIKKSDISQGFIKNFTAQNLGIALFQVEMYWKYLHIID